MKKYTIEVTQTEKSDNVPFNFHMSRENKGFSVYEMIGFVTMVRDELIIQALSMFDSPDVTRKSIHKDRAVTVEIDTKEKK